MTTNVCSIRLFVAVALLSSFALVVREADARVASPAQPQRWLVVASPDSSGVAVHARRWGEGLAAWPDGTVLGLLGELVVEHGTTWVTVQDPDMIQGWVMLDRLTDLPVQVAPTPRRTGEGELGGVRPLDGTGPKPACPDRFPIKGTLERQGGYLRLAFPPESRDYADVPTITCFRTLKEAQAWRFLHRPLARPTPPSTEDAAVGARIDELLP